MSTRHVANQYSHLIGQDGEVWGLAWGIVPKFSCGGTVMLVWLGLLAGVKPHPYELEGTHNAG